VKGERWFKRDLPFLGCLAMQEKLDGAVLPQTKQRSSLNKKSLHLNYNKKGRKTHFPLSKTTILSPSQHAIKQMLDQQSLKSLSF